MDSRLLSWRKTLNEIWVGVATPLAYCSHFRGGWETREKDSLGSALLQTTCVTLGIFRVFTAEDLECARMRGITKAACTNRSCLECKCFRISTQSLSVPLATVTGCVSRFLIMWKLSLVIRLRCHVPDSNLERYFFVYRGSCKLLTLPVNPD